MRQDFSGDDDAKRLAELFPILLEEHNPAWSAWYEREAAFLRSVFGGGALRIRHIGSTAVPGLIAKPTVDILLEVSQDIDLPAMTETMREEGYVVNTPKNDLIMYLKGYTPRGFEGQAAHIHVRHYGDWDEPHFCAYLAAHPGVAEEYGKLKRVLKERFEHDRDGYTAAKGEFVRKYTELARRNAL